VLAQSPDGSGRSLLVGLTDHCTLDRSFGHNGEVALPSGAGASQTTYSDLTADGTGRLLVSGGADHGGWLVGAFTAGGQPVTSFGRSGWVTLPDPGPRRTSYGGGEASAVTVGADGVIYVIGSDGQPLCCSRTTVVALSPDGARRESFGRRGRSTPVPDGGVIDLVSPWPAGGVLAIGQFDSTGGGSYQLSTYDAEGHRLSDSSEELPPPDNFFAFAIAVLQHPEGDTLLVDQVTAAAPQASFTKVAAYTRAGAPDRNFGAAGATRAVPGVPFGAFLDNSGTWTIGVRNQDSCELETVSASGRLSGQPGCGVFPGHVPSGSFAAGGLWPGGAGAVLAPAATNSHLVEIIASGPGGFAVKQQAIEPPTSPPGRTR
jgi:hypothetical protein